ncbi:hypothetical protein MLD38_027291 [Melastoma candidum]|uniref:Uncharacterized protein n=1 Tax=Melastoma candidum TaxID=119954 RepID=A0ACB9P4K1_9MYRT|nr:hypothetical protein MLD38_027291 [Melastoma candidum]
MPPKIQPIDINARLLGSPVQPARTDSAKPVLKSRLKRLFDRQFPGVLRNNYSGSNVPSEKQTAVDGPFGKDGLAAYDFEPSSVCLAKMVQNFIEETNERQVAAKCGRNRCNCFNGNNNDSSDDEFDIFDGFVGEFLSGGPSCDVSDVLKGLIQCSSVAERTLLADTAKILEKNKGQKRKEVLRKIVADSLSSNGYDSSICTSKWDKAPTFPAGEYEYIDVMIGGERLMIDIDFRSEFEIARSTSTYKAVLQSLPFVFVGKEDRLGQIVAIVSEAARQSLKKKGMHFPPWRKAEYMKAKWLSPYSRTTPSSETNMMAAAKVDEPDAGVEVADAVTADDESRGDLELIFGEAETEAEEEEASQGEDEKKEESSWWATVVVAKPRSMERAGGGKVVTGLASLLKDKP